jgi:hypothetical protein
VTESSEIEMPPGLAWRRPALRMPRGVKRTWLALRRTIGHAWRWVLQEVGVGVAPVATGSPELGMTFVLSGIEGASIHTHGMARGLRDGGVPGAMTVFEWGERFPIGFLGKLVRRNRGDGARLAAAITAYQMDFPGRPVWIMAQSGGAGIAVFAVEALGEGHAIEGIVLLNPALSPTYDLRPALVHLRHGLLNSHSARDWLVLGWGTRVFGTSDREYVAAAGRVGFLVPKGAEAYRKVTQLAWCERYGRECSHWGGHVPSGRGTFLRRVIGPWMVGRGGGNGS